MEGIRLKKVGIIGGTFDPPHHGHLLMASEVLTALQLEEVWFMPTNIPPHKQSEHITNRTDRVEMLRLAIADNPHFKLQLIELEREGPSFTYDTMEILRERYPQYSFYFILGADMVEYLPNWYKIDELVQIVTFVGVKRPGYVFLNNYSICEVEVLEFEVSSSLLRERFKAGKNTMYLLPEKVKNYIEEKGLYGTE